MSDEAIEHWHAAAEAHRLFEEERDRLAAVRPLTLREAATVLAGLRHLARLVNGGR